MKISVCGIACEKCPRMQKGICPNGNEGCTPKLTGPCKIKHCAVEKKVRYCFECDEFPCSKLAPAADKADILPHNTKLFNLCMIKKIGLEDFIKKSLEIKQTYYKGKMEVGKGPNLDK